MREVAGRRSRSSPLRDMINSKMATYRREASFCLSLTASTGSPRSYARWSFKTTWNRSLNLFPRAHTQVPLQRHLDWGHPQHYELRNPPQLRLLSSHRATFGCRGCKGGCLSPMWSDAQVKISEKHRNNALGCEKLGNEAKDDDQVCTGGDRH
jgi:hypothetical protein